MVRDCVLLKKKEWQGEGWRVSEWLGQASLNCHHREGGVGIGSDDDFTGVREAMGCRWRLIAVAGGDAKDDVVRAREGVGPRWRVEFFSLEGIAAESRAIKNRLGEV
jgi:hypothetical protein